MASAPFYNAYTVADPVAPWRGPGPAYGVQEAEKVDLVVRVTFHRAGPGM